MRYNEKLVGGAYKDVYVGFDRVENIEVAWNQIDFEGAYDEEAREILLKLYTEAHILNFLKHESIIMCFSRLFDSEAKTISVITELFPSISLRKLRRTKSKCDGAVSGIDLAAIKNWGRQILEGLNFLYIIRTLRSSIETSSVTIFLFIVVGNKLSSEDLITCDFDTGIAYAAYINPSIYAFGMCLLEMVTGEYPYRECSNELQVFRKASAGVKPASLANVKDSRVKDIIDKCLLPMSLRPSAQALLKDPFFLYDGGSTLEACTSTASCEIFRAGAFCFPEYDANIKIELTIY
ncbi:serine/threonine-protein kinase WNK8-like [Nicotiana tabacum]|uniref:Serine/threonine-protein kinase WNK8-like n=1 Tax=Nicotiana tabacum TaxID=4097 RepID=A0AC58T3A1_TOBAC